jgi:DNA-binding MarR family transcriptional regulator
MDKADDGVLKSNSYLLQHVTTMFGRQLDRVLQEQLGIGTAQLKIITLLRATPELRQKQLADRLGQTEASISRQVKLLLIRGLLVAEVNPRNRREHIVLLTPKGSKLADAAQVVEEHYAQTMINTLSDKQQKQLAEILDKLHAQTCKVGKAAACEHN